ncbi:hypothetical protein [Cerasicoccus maritimus]|uniref:hypothetical protein n=1 Tax=Cerasicoccus maritimus TaxID=490089 RepID=UPI0028525F30|nr:hypothetical protein [Cerasicoccus maritimus]
MKPLPTITMISLAAALFVAGFWVGRSGGAQTEPAEKLSPEALPTAELMQPAPTNDAATTALEAQNRLLRDQLAEETRLRQQLEKELKQADAGKRAYEWFREAMDDWQFQGVNIKPISRDDLQLTDTLLIVSGIDAEAYEQLESDRKQLLHDVRNWEQANAITTEMENGGVSIEIPPMSSELSDAFLAKSRQYMDEEQADFVAKLYGRPFWELTQTRYVEVKYSEQRGEDWIDVSIRGEPDSGFLSSMSRTPAATGYNHTFVKRWDHLVELEKQ